MAFDAGSVTSKLFLDTNPFRQGILQAESLMRIFPASVTNFMASPLLGVVGIAGQVGGALKNMVSDALVTGVKLAASFEQAEVALGTMLGGAAQAKAVLGDLSAFAASTPFELPELVEATKKLTAFGIEQAELIPTLTSIGDISAGLGIRVGELAEIYGKARVQGRLFMEDINQLSGRGIPIQHELARQFGVTADQVRKLVETGQVNFGHMEAAFKNLTAEGGKFGGMMEAQSQTLNGLWSTLTDNYNTLLREVGTELVKAFDLRGVIQSSADYILSNKAAIVGAVREVTVSVVELVNVLKDAAKHGKPIFEAIQLKLDAAGITDPANRTAVKNPMQGMADPDFFSGLDKTDVLGTAAGREFLARVARGQLTAAQAFGGTNQAVEDLGFRDSETRRAQDIAADLQAQTKAYRETLAELGAMLGKPAGQISAEQFDAMIAKVNAFGAALRTAAAEMEGIRDRAASSLDAGMLYEGTGGPGKFSAALDPGLGGFRSAMDAIIARRGLVSDMQGGAAVGVDPGAGTPGLDAPPPAVPVPVPVPVPDVSFPNLANPVADLAPRGPAAGEGGGAGGGSAQPLQAAFAALTRGVLASRDGFSDLRDSMRDFAEDLTQLAVEVIRPLIAQGGTGEQEGGGGGGKVALGNVNVSTPPFNMNEATSQVAGKLRPQINQAFENLRREFEGAIHADRVRQSMEL